MKSSICGTTLFTLLGSGGTKFTIWYMSAVTFSPLNGATRHAQRLAFADQRAQLHALDVFHRHEHHVAALADVVNGDDVRMVEAAGGLGFLVEALLVFVGVFALEGDVHGLDRDRPLEHGIG